MVRIALIPVSRVMVHLFSRLTRLISRASRSKLVITETDNPGDLTLVPPPQDPDRPPTPTSAWLAQLMKTGGPSGPVDPLVAEARKLNADVDAWIESLQVSTLEHERVQVGNRAYAHAMKVCRIHCRSEQWTNAQILLLRRVFQYPREDARVQAAANEVLRHCSTSTAILGMSIE